MTALSAGETGVPPSTGDGTPVYLDPAMSADALIALELDDVLEVAAACAAGPLGAEALRSRRPTDDIAWIRRELALVGEALAVIRRGSAMAVAPVPDVTIALGRLRIAGSVLEVTELSAIRATLRASHANADELRRHAEACPRIAAIAAPPVDRSIVRVLEPAIGDDDELLDAASPALAAARREVHAARERLVRRLESLLREADPSAIPGGASVTLRSGRYVIPVRRDSRQRPEGIVHDESGSAGTLFIEPTVAIELGNALRAAITAEARETLVALRELTNRVRPAREPIAALHAMSVELDTIVARARWAASIDGEVPEVRDGGGELRLRGARHPLLLARGITVVPFDLSLEGPERTLLISGPNTGGKTVLLKTVGLSLALVQSGFVPGLGAESVLSVVRRIFVDIGDHQSLAADLSTFSAHVAMLRRILDSADAATLILLDEIGSGTDPAEGGALAMAVLETLTVRGSITLATTHLGTLKSLATRVPGVINGSLQFDATTLSPTYRFTKGIPGRSYGLAIARRLGVDRRVLGAAEAMVPEAERELDRLLATVEARRQALDLLEAELDRRRSEIDLREAVAATTAEAQHVREAALRQQEKQAARDQARQAKAYLLEARKRVEQALALAHEATEEAAAKDARRIIEDGIRSESGRLEEPDEPESGGNGGLQVGGRVRLNTGVAGELAELRGDGKAVVLVGTMRLVVAARTLSPLGGSGPVRRARPAASAVHDESPREAAYAIDLRGMRADEAEAVVTAAIDSAVMAEQPHLAIIHGMGTGVLRDTVRGLLAADKRVASFDFAPRQQGGVGVTVAVFR